MSWIQTTCRAEVHGGGQGGRAMLADARGDFSAFRGQAQCVYLDPPFMTGEDFTLRMRVGREGWETGNRCITLPAYSDKFRDRDMYLALLRGALENAKLLLNDTGSLFLHLDNRMSGYARLLCDEIFGESNFVNEIVWAYQSGGRSMKRFSRKHDMILFYRKSRRHYFNIAAVPLPRGVNRSNHMRKCVDASGRTYRTIQSGGKTYTYYDDEPVYPSDVWADVSHLQQKDPQRTGYDTQKPQALLSRIILATTRPGDLVCDLFGGSGTTAVAAAEAGRRYLIADNSPAALTVTRKRLLDTAMTLEQPCGCEGANMAADFVPGIAFHDVRLTDYTTPPGCEISGLDAVDQWSVGFLRGDVFEAQASAARRRHTPDLPDFLQLPQLRGVPAILIVDVYGNRTLWRMEP